MNLLAECMLQKADQQLHSKSATHHLSLVCSEYNKLYTVNLQTGTLTNRVDLDNISQNVVFYQDLHLLACASIEKLDRFFLQTYFCRLLQ